jgi:hypothetical protein
MNASGVMANTLICKVVGHASEATVCRALVPAAGVSAAASVQQLSNLPV